MTRLLEPIRVRLKAVREATGLTQERFAERLNEASRALYGPDGPQYRQGNLTKIETGAQHPSFEDVAVWAAVDPKRRGKLWLGWDETRDSATRPETIEEVSARTGIAVARPKQQFPAPETEKATRAGGQKGKRHR